MKAYEKLIRWYLRWLRRGAAVLGAVSAAVLSATAFLLLGLTALINLLAMAFYPVFTRCAARTAMAEMGAAYVSPVKFNGLYLAFWRSSLLWFTCPRSVNGALLLAALVAFGLTVTAVCTFARRRAVFAGLVGLAAFAALVLWQETQSLRPVLITALAACVIYLWWALYEYRKTRFLD